MANQYSIFNACTNLLKELRRKPTRREVQDRVGKRTSMSTIQKYAAEWERRYDGLIREVTGADTGLPDPLVSHVLGIYSGAQEEAVLLIEAKERDLQEALDKERKALDQELAAVRKEAQLQVSSAEERARRSESELGAALARVEEKDSALQDLRARADSLHSSVEFLQEQVNRLTHEKLDALERLDAARTELESSQAKTNTLKKDKRQLQVRVTSISRELDKLHKKIESLSGHLAP